ncbi:MAG: hypothetical protein N0E48_18220 [Candidatus Thiodiazotropha endolucinida]|nr:hypothetical protein [Candidatus Thiodiazotropha taylori]MCW4345271.1 hypothetical protein [Candidatus Thiodiazotropha endolucinida]
MVPIPRICHSFLCALWNPVSQMKGAWNMMGLADRMTVLRLQVNCSSRGAISLAGNYHPGAPCCGGIWINTFKHANANISFKICVDLVLPVNRD